MQFAGQGTGAQTGERGQEMSRRLAEILDFPAAHPEGFPLLEKEPDFDPGRHLAIEKPETIVSLQAFGYQEEEISNCPTDLAVTSCFRILSDEGAACLLEVARGLEPHSRSIERIPRLVRGGVYQSRFLRDFCTAPELTEAISDICETPVLPHTMPHQLGHLNYNPFVAGGNIDKWHADTLRIDFVLFVTDPNAIEGGEFQYFHGTTHEVAEIHETGKPLPADRVISPAMPGPGYAILQQGNMVVHRAKALSAPGERITLVNGYVPAELNFPDYTRFDQLVLADPANIAASEYARHVAWMGREALNAQIEGFEFSVDRDRFADQLDRVAKLLAGAASEIRKTGNTKMEHFGDS